MTSNTTTEKKGTRFSAASRERARADRRPLSKFLLLVLALLSFAIPTARAETGPAIPASSNRFLLIVETSATMQRRISNTVVCVHHLLSGQFGNQLRPGDTIGVWTFDDHLATGQFPLQTWAPEQTDRIAQVVCKYLEGVRPGRQAELRPMVTAFTALAQRSPTLTVILLSSGEGAIRGTPFDDAINRDWAAWRKEQQRARMPIVTVFQAVKGTISRFTVTAAPFPPEIPDLPRPVPTITPLVESRPPAPVASSPPSAPPSAPPLIIKGPAKATVVPPPSLAQPALTVEVTEPQPSSPPTTLPVPTPEQKATPAPAPVPSAAPAEVTAPVVQSSQTSNPAAPEPALREKEPAPSVSAPPEAASEGVPAKYDSQPGGALDREKQAPAEVALMGLTPNVFWTIAVGLAAAVLACTFLLWRHGRKPPARSLITDSIEKQPHQ